MKFKVGDKVRIKSNLKEIENFAGGYNSELGKCVGDIVTITDISKDYKDRTGANVKENGWFWDLRALEKVEEVMKKEDLKNGDIVTLKSGDKLVLFEDELQTLDGESHYVDYIDEYDDDLRMENRYHSEYDIVKVERPVEYTTVFEREEVQELTVDEISERLGYKVKVVGEDR